LREKSKFAFEHPGIMKKSQLFLFVLVFFSLRYAIGQTLEMKEIYRVYYRTDISSLADSTKEDLFPRSNTTGAIHFYRGINYLHQKYYSDAIRDFKEARKDTTLSKSLCNFYIGMAFMELDMPDSILSICSFALGIPVAQLKKPEFWENSPFTKDQVFFSYLIGTNEVLHSSTDTALIDALFGYSVKEPKFYEANFNYGNYCYTIGRYNKSVDFFLKARELDKAEDSTLLLGLGYFYRLAADLDQSQKAYDMLLSHYSNLAAGYNNRGCLFGYMEKYDASIHDLNKAIKKNPRLVEAYCNRGLVFLKTGKWDKSISDFSTVLQFKPEYSDAHYFRGFAKKNKGDLVGSVIDFTKAIELKKSISSGN